MGLGEDVSSREGLLASMEEVTSKQFLLVRNLAGPVRAAFREAGVEVLNRGFRAFGEWRGENMRVALGTIVAGVDAAAVLRDWDSCELLLGTLEQGGGKICGRASQASLTLPSMPGSDYFLRYGDPDLLRSYWTETLTGMAAGHGMASRFTCTAGELDAPWTITIEVPQAEGGAGAVRATELDTQILSDPVRALALIRASARNAGALYMFVAREVIRTYDATGEQLIREGVREFGRERGSALREKHLREGRPLNLKSLMLDWDGPLVSTWVFTDSGYLSEGTWHQDCLYCPYADVWSEYGAEGLALGLLYDIELHTTMYQTYHPGVLVRWEALKTRGDHLCKFRFSIPELVRPQDPDFTKRS